MGCSVTMPQRTLTLHGVNYTWFRSSIGGYQLMTPNITVTVISNGYDADMRIVSIMSHYPTTRILTKTTRSNLHEAFALVDYMMRGLTEEQILWEVS